MAGAYESCPELKNLRLLPLLCSCCALHLLCQEGQEALSPVADVLLSVFGMCLCTLSSGYWTGAWRKNPTAPGADPVAQELQHSLDHSQVSGLLSKNV